MEVHLAVKDPSVTLSVHIFPGIEDSIKYKNNRSVRSPVINNKNIHTKGKNKNTVGGGSPSPLSNRWQ